MAIAAEVAMPSGPGVLVAGVRLVYSGWEYKNDSSDDDSNRDLRDALAL